jgi:DNA-binding MarR family transcriptional regulator
MQYQLSNPQATKKSRPKNLRLIMDEYAVLRAIDDLIVPRGAAQSIDTIAAAAGLSRARTDAAIEKLAKAGRIVIIEKEASAPVISVSVTVIKAVLFELVRLRDRQLQDELTIHAGQLQKLIDKLLDIIVREDPRLGTTLTPDQRAVLLSAHEFERQGKEASLRDIREATGLALDDAGKALVGLHNLGLLGGPEKVSSQ